MTSIPKSVLDPEKIKPERSFLPFISLKSFSDADIHLAEKTIKTHASAAVNKTSKIPESEKKAAPKILSIAEIEKKETKDHTSNKKQMKTDPNIENRDSQTVKTTTMKIKKNDLK